MCKLIVSLGDHTRYSCININHDHHGYEERAHGRKHNVSGVTIVTAHLVHVLSRFVPERTFSVINLQGVGLYRREMCDIIFNFWGRRLRCSSLNFD